MSHIPRFVKYTGPASPLHALMLIHGDNLSRLCSFWADRFVFKILAKPDLEYDSWVEMSKATFHILAEYRFGRLPQDRRVDKYWKTQDPDTHEYYLGTFKEFPNSTAVETIHYKIVIV